MSSDEHKAEAREALNRAYIWEDAWPGMEAPPEFSVKAIAEALAAAEARGKLAGLREALSAAEFAEIGTIAWGEVETRINARIATLSVKEEGGDSTHHAMIEAGKETGS